MKKMFFKLALRNLFNNRSQSILNILCLAIGMASILIILTYVKYEYSYDKFIENADKVFRVEKHVTQINNESGFYAAHQGPLGPELKAQCPEINQYSRIYRSAHPMVAIYKDRKALIKKRGAHWVDAAFLTIFDCLILKGDKKNALIEPNTVVLTESIAKIYFGNEEPLGKSIKVDNDIYRVTGICADPPPNTHFHYKYLFSYSTLLNNPAYSWLNSWRSGAPFLYVKLNPGFNKENVEKRMLDIYKINTNPDHISQLLHFDLHLRPITDIHLNCEEGSQLEKNSDINLIRFILLFAIFILLMSFVNAINLSTSKSLERAKEVGVRKVVGGHKAQLIYQFIAEYLFLNIFAMIIALVLFMISPILLKQVFLNYNFLALEILKEGWIWILILILLIVSVLVSGLYPAFILSSYNPLSVLRGKLATSSKGIVIRNCLIVFQLVITIALIGGVIIISKQFKFMQSKDLGFDIDNILIINGLQWSSDTTYLSAYTSFKTELLKYNKFNSISVSTDIPGRKPSRGLRYSLNKSMENPAGTMMFYSGYSFLDVYGMKILAGRNIRESYGTDFRTVIINETVSKRLNFKNPEEAIDKFIFERDHEEPLKIIAVIADYNQVSPKIEKSGITIELNNDVRSFISINLNTTDSKNTISIINSLWEKYFPNKPFNYYFLNDFYKQQYIIDNQFGNIINFFTIITIIIICIGLWSLSSYTISVRAKELGIRRVLNASQLDIVLLLLKYFYRLILVGAVISLPITYYLFNNWLNNFAYRISIGWWFFVMPILLISVITILIVGYGILKVSNKNLAETLKYE